MSQSLGELMAMPHSENMAANLERIRVEKLGLERLAKIEEAAFTTPWVSRRPLTSPPARMMFLNPSVVHDYEPIRKIDFGQLQADYDKAMPDTIETYTQWVTENGN
jgi:hypothetical protein